MNQNKNASAQLDKKEKIANLLAYQMPAIKADGENDPLFSPKMQFYAKPEEVVGEPVVMFFESELSSQKNIYIELVTADFLIPEGSKRQLYKYKANAHYKEECPVRTFANGSKGYLVPMSELITLGEVKSDGGIDPEFELELPDPNADLPYNQLTIRDHIAIMWKKPIASKPFINELIRKETNG